MRVQRSRRQKYNLWSFHGVMLRKINLKLVRLVGVQSSGSSIDFDDPPLEIVGDFVFETGGRIDLPLHKLFLEPIASNFAKCLAGGGGGAGHACFNNYVMDDDGDPQKKKKIRRRFVPVATLI